MIEDSFIIITEDGNLMHFKHAEKLPYHKNMLYKAICNEREYVLKISENDSVSYLHLQYLSYKKIYSTSQFSPDIEWGVIVGNVLTNHDVIIMPVYHNIITLDNAFQMSHINSRRIAEKLAWCICNMHKQGISGFDTEFYWSMEFDNLVVLDIGLPFTFDLNNSEIVSRQLYYEKENLLGIQYIVQSCCPLDKLHTVKKINHETFEILVNNLKFVDRGIEEIAKVHAVDFWGRLGEDRLNLFGIFYDEYNKMSKFELTRHQEVYLKTMKEALQDNLRYAACSLYNVKLPVRITSRCVANAEGTGYMHCI